MVLNRFALACASLCLAVAVLPAHGVENCWIQKAVRDGNGVKVYLFRPRGNPPGVAVPMHIVRTNGSGLAINEPAVTSEHPFKMTTRNPRTQVLLHPGDKLEFAGMDYGCSVTLVHVDGKPELKIEGGLPHNPGLPNINNHYAYFMPVTSGN